jgi:uncharacterized coiled-coil DUF342 family protein
MTASEGALTAGGEGVAGPAERAVSKGISLPQRPGGRSGFLSDLIVELGFVDQDTVDAAVEEARHRGRTAADILLESGDLGEDQLSRAIAEHHGLNHVDLDEFEVDLDVARLVGRSPARRYRAVPIAFDSDGALIVALADPVDALAVSDIAAMTRSDVRPVVASGAAIDALIEQLPVDASRAEPDGTGPGLTPPEPPVAEGPPEPVVEGHPEPVVEGHPEPVRANEQPLPAPQTGDAEPTAAAPSHATHPGGGGDLQHDPGDPELEDVRSALAKLGAWFEASEPRAQELHAERDRLREEVERAAEERKELVGERDGLREEVQRAARERDELAGEHDRLREEFEHAVEAREDADRRAEAESAALAELREERDRERAESTNAEEKLRAELAQAGEGYQELRAELAEAGEQNQKLEAGLAESAKVEQELRAEVDEAREANRALEQRLLTLQAATGELEQHLLTLRAATGELTAVSEKIAALHGEAVSANEHDGQPE